MDVKKIKFSSNLIQTKIRLERELNEINRLIDENTEDCDHLRVKVTEGPNSSTRCLFCGQKLLGQGEELIINACGYKCEEYHKGYGQVEKLARLNDLRRLTIEYLLVEPELTREELIEKLNKELEKDEQKQLKK